MSWPIQINRRTQIIAGAAAGLVVLIVVGGLVAIRLVEGSTPPPLTSKLVGAASPVGASPASPSASPSPPASPPGAAAGPSPSPAAAAAPSPTLPSTDGTWRIGSGSVAGYRVQETLFGQGHIAVGRTGSIQGSLTVAGGTLTAATFTVDMTTVRSDRSERDQQFQTRIMDTATYPTGQFVLSQPVTVGAALASGRSTLHVTGNLTLRGVTHLVSLQITVTAGATTVNATGALQVTFADYAIPNPSNSVAQTGDQGVLEFSLNFVR